MEIPASTSLSTNTPLNTSSTKNPEENSNHSTNLNNPEENSNNSAGLKIPLTTTPEIG